MPVIEGRFQLHDSGEWSNWTPISPFDKNGNLALNLLLSNDPNSIIMKQLDDGSIIQWRYKK